MHWRWTSKKEEKYFGRSRDETVRSYRIFAWRDVFVTFVVARTAVARGRRESARSSPVVLVGLGGHVHLLVRRQRRWTRRIRVLPYQAGGRIRIGAVHEFVMAVSGVGPLVVQGRFCRQELHRFGIGHELVRAAVVGRGLIAIVVQVIVRCLLMVLLLLLGLSSRLNSGMPEFSLSCQFVLRGG